MDERKNKEIKTVESSISLDITAQRRARKDLENKITKQVDETSFALRLDLAREKKLHLPSRGNGACLSEAGLKGKESRQESGKRRLR